LDFETKLFAKPDAARLLEQELAEKGYAPRTIAMGTNTDPYQPIERRYRITRAILEVLDRTSHPVGIVTKSALVLRDLDILTRMAERGLVKVALSITSLDNRLSRAMEPRASAPHRRLQALETLSAAGVPTAVMVAPVVPGLNEAELDKILERAASAGATEAGYILLRLPAEVREIFEAWLVEHYPDRAEKVLSLMRTMRGGKEYEAEWGLRMSGTGPHAWLIGRRFEQAAKRNRLNRRKLNLRTELFEKPVLTGGQYRLI
ncbi:MAG: PA0069 family radical SAM protein, partial [Rhodobiaceae bacterium]|nr:PA0069 family radical SAM protein [Rhodobiaceae bacterium]